MVSFSILLLCRASCRVWICIGTKEPPRSTWMETATPSILSFYIIRYFLNDFNTCKWNSLPGNEYFPMCLTPPQPKRMTKGDGGVLWWKERSVDWRWASKPEPTLSVEWGGWSACDIWGGWCACDIWLSPNSSCDPAMLAQWVCLAAVAKPQVPWNVN